MIPVMISDKIKDEISKQIPDSELSKLIRYAFCWEARGSDILIQEIRVVGLDSAPIMFDMAKMNASFEETFKLVLASKPVPVVPGSEQTYQPLGVPKLVILDVCVHYFSLCISAVASV